VARNEQQGSGARGKQGPSQPHSVSVARHRVAGNGSLPVDAWQAAASCLLTDHDLSTQREELKQARAVNDKLRREKGLAESVAPTSWSVHRVAPSPVIIHSTPQRQASAQLALERERCRRALSWRLQSSTRARRRLLFKHWQYIVGFSLCILTIQCSVRLRRRLARVLKAWSAVRRSRKRRLILLSVLIGRTQRVLLRSMFMLWNDTSRRQRISFFLGGRLTARCKFLRSERVVRAWRAASRYEGSSPMEPAGSRLC
jgi:hypothetical protein